MSLRYIKDLAERVGATFLASASAVLLANLASVTDLTVWKGAAIAGAAAVVTLAKGLAVKPVGDPDTAGVVAPPVEQE